MDKVRDNSLCFFSRASDSFEMTVGLTVIRLETAPAQKKLSTVARRTPSPIRPTQGVSYLNKSSDVNNTDDRGPATSLDRPMTPPSASD